MYVLFTSVVPLGLCVGIEGRRAGSSSDGGGVCVTVEFVISNRGRRHMRLGGFSFYAEKVFPEKSKVRWRCTRRTCRAYAHTLHDRIFALSNLHSHEPPAPPASHAPLARLAHAHVKAILDD